MHEIIVLSDEEFYAKKKKEKRKSFLSELEQMSKPSTKGASSFSIKNVKTKPVEPEKDEPVDPDSMAAFMKINTTNIEDVDFGEFVEDLQGVSILSPIESVTDENITGFQLDSDIVDPDDNKYGKVFKKDLAMLSEVLKDVKAHGTRVNNILKSMNVGGKGTSSRTTGVPKGYSDLVEAYNSINTSKVQIIKAMTDLRSKQIEWSLKDKAAQGPDSESTDNIADMYYKRIIGGGTKNFIQSSMENYQSSDFDYDPVTDGQSSYQPEFEGDPSTIDALAISTGFNITQPIRGSKYYQGGNDIIGDEHGYITNEQTDYEICVYQYGENQYQFGAITSDGEPLDGIELPSDSNPDIVESLHLKLGSNFIYDKYGRKYRLIEMGSVDIGDIDDMEYPYD